MSHQYLLLAIFSCALFIALPSPAIARGGALWRLLHGADRHQSPSYAGNPQRRVAAPPGPHRYPEYNAAATPWYGYGFGVPTYSWGYFGARYRPAVISHTGYHGDFTQWGYRRGY